MERVSTETPASVISIQQCWDANIHLCHMGDLSFSCHSQAVICAADNTARLHSTNRRVFIWIALCGAIYSKEQYTGCVT